MSTHDMTIINDTGANVRGDIEDGLQALASCSTGITAPTTTYPGQLWFDTSGLTNVLKIRNAANAAWITLPLNVDDSTKVGFLESGSFMTVGNYGFKFADTSVQVKAFPGNLKYVEWDTMWASTITAGVWVQVGAVADRFDCAITPASASNSVMVTLDFKLSYLPTAGYASDGVAVQVRRAGTTPLHVGTGALAVTAGYHTGSIASATNSEEYEMKTYSASFIDNPATTSATTYSVWVYAPAYDTSIYTNRPYTNVRGVSGASSIILQELPAATG